MSTVRLGVGCWRGRKTCDCLQHAYAYAMQVDEEYETCHAELCLEKELGDAMTNTARV